MIVSIGVNFSDGQRFGDVQLSRAESSFLGVDVLNGIETNAVEMNAGGVPVGCGFSDLDALAGAPFFERERTVADKGLGACPVVTALEDGAIFFDDGHRDGPPNPVLEK